MEKENLTKEKMAKEKLAEELTDEQLEMVAGGSGDDESKPVPPEFISIPKPIEPSDIERY